MTPGLVAAYINSQVMCAQIEMQGMIVANAERMASGSSLAYDEGAFYQLMERYNISEHAVKQMFQKLADGESKIVTLGGS